MTVSGHPLVEQAHAALSRLADAPAAADAAKAASRELDHAWSKPFVVGIGGELPARTELFNLVCDGKFFDPFARALGGAALRFRRGRETAFRAFRDDGTTEQQVMPPDPKKELAAARGRAEAARGQLAERESAIERIDSTLPKRPAVWAIWMWPVYWIATWLARRKRPERKLAELALVEAQQTYDTVERDAAALEAQARLARNRFIDQLRNLAGGGPIGTGILEVEVTLASGPLPDGIEIVELAGASRASAEVDAVFLAKGNELLSPVRGGDPLPFGDPAEVIRTLPSLLADARALRLAHRVEAKVASAMSSLADAIERKESTFRARIDRLHEKRLPDPAAFANEQLENVRGEISSSVTAVVEHAAVHLGSELAALQDDWIGSLANAPDSTAFDAAVARIENVWNSEPKRIADEVRVLVMGGLGGSARDIYPTVVQKLIDFGLPEQDGRIKAAPELPEVVLLPSLVKETAKLEKPGWFAGLFRSFETRKTTIREKVHDRLERMRELASSELLDAEPQLNQAIGTALASLLDAAIAKQQAWLDQAFEAERVAIAQERRPIVPLIEVRDAVRGEANRLSELIGQLEGQEPAIAVAAAAAETASLSH